MLVITVQLIVLNVKAEVDGVNALASGVWPAFVSGFRVP